MVNATTPTIATQLSDLTIDDKNSIADQQNESESLSKFVFDCEDDASTTCTCLLMIHSNKYFIPRLLVHLSCGLYLFLFYNL